MNIYHKLDWDKCLSHEIWEAFKKGWPESTVVIRFWIISIVLAMIGLATLKLR